MDDQSLDFIFIDANHLDNAKTCFGREYSETASRCLWCLRRGSCIFVSLDNILAEINSVTSPEQLPKYLASEFLSAREAAIEKLEQFRRRKHATRVGKGYVPDTTMDEAESKLASYLGFELTIFDLLELWEKLDKNMLSADELGVADYLVCVYGCEPIWHILSKDLIPKLVSEDPNEQEKALEIMAEMGMGL